MLSLLRLAEWRDDFCSRTSRHLSRSSARRRSPTTIAQPHVDWATGGSSALNRSRSSQAKDDRADRCSARTPTRCPLVRGRGRRRGGCNLVRTSTSRDHRVDERAFFSRRLVSLTRTATLPHSSSFSYLLAHLIRTRTRTHTQPHRAGTQPPTRTHISKHLCKNLFTFF